MARATVFFFLNNFEIPSPFSCKNLECQNQANNTWISQVRISSCKSFPYNKNISIHKIIHKKTISKRCSTVLRLFHGGVFRFIWKYRELSFSETPNVFILISLNSDDVTSMNFLEKGRWNLEDEIRGNEILSPFRRVRVLAW